MDESEIDTKTPPPPKRSPNNHFCCPNSNCKCNTLLYCLAAFLTLVILSRVAYLYSIHNQPPISPTKITKIKVTPIPTSDPNASWKTYTDTKNGFKFKYPPNWINKNNQYSPKNTVVQFGEESQAGTPGDPSPLSFIIYLSLGANSISNDSESKTLNKETVRVDANNYQLKTYERLEAEATMQVSDIIKVSNNNIVYYMEFSHTSDGCGIKDTNQEEKQQCYKWNQDKTLEYKNTRNQILSTFKFLDQPTITP